MNDKKASDIRILKVGQHTTLADYFIIATGASTTQIKAIADEIEKVLHEQGVLIRHKEGYVSANWILLDYGNVVTHVFHKDMRTFYSLEKLWADAPEIAADSL
jgi:ribosome-associated protein